MLVLNEKVIPFCNILFRLQSLIVEELLASDVSWWKKAEARCINFLNVSCYAALQLMPRFQGVLLLVLNQAGFYCVFLFSKIRRSHFIVPVCHSCWTSSAIPITHQYRGSKQQIFLGHFSYCLHMYQWTIEIATRDELYLGVSFSPYTLSIYYCSNLLKTLFCLLSLINLSFLV